MGVSDRGGEDRHVAAELWRGGREPTLVAVGGGWFLSIGLRMVYPAVLPYLRADFGFDLMTAGFLITALWVAYALGQFPSGLLDDRVGADRLLIVSTAVSAVTLAIVVTVGSVGMLFVGTALFGLAMELDGVSRFTLLVTTYPDRGCTAVGLVQSAGDVGSSVSRRWRASLPRRSLGRSGSASRFRYFCSPVSAFTPLCLTTGAAQRGQSISRPRCGRWPRRYATPRSRP